jgi:hypothetical protein
VVIDHAARSSALISTLTDFMLIEQGKLIKEDRTQGEQLTAVQAFDGHLAIPFEDIVKQAIEGFDGLGS